MPYEIIGHAGKYTVRNKDNKKVHAKHTTYENAQAQVRLLQAIEHNPKFKPKKK